MSSTRAIATSTLWQMASQITMAALSIVTVKFVALGLSKELAGLYNSAYGYLQLFGILADFGLYAVAVRELSRSQDQEKTLGTLFVLRFVILSLSLGAALLIVWTMPAWRGSALRLGVTIAALVPFFTLLAGMIRSSFQVHYRMHYVFIAEVAQRILTVSLTGLLILQGIRDSGSITMYYLFMAIGSAGALLLFVLSLWFNRSMVPLRPHWDSALFRRTLTLAAPYGIAFLCTALYRQFDVTLIALLRPDFEVQNAYYGFVQRMMDMAYLLPTFLLNSTLPVLSARDERGEDTRQLVGKTFLIILLISVVAYLFAAAWPRALMLLLTRESYLSMPGQPGADSALQILSVSMFFNGLVLFGFYSMLTRHAWKPLVWTLAIGSVVSLALNIWLIPTLGFVGASLTSALTHIVLAALLLPQSLRILPMRFPLVYLWQWLGFSVLLGIFVFGLAPYLTNSLSTAFALAVSVPVLGICAWITGLHRTLRT